MFAMIDNEYKEASQPTNKSTVESRVSVEDPHGVGVDILSGVHGCETTDSTDSSPTTSLPRPPVYQLPVECSHFEYWSPPGPGAQNKHSVPS